MEILINNIVELLSVVITTFVGMGFVIIQQYLKKKWQIDIGNFVNNVEITEAIGVQIKKIKKEFGEKLSDHEFENIVVNNVITYIGQQFPKWTKEYGFTSVTLESYIRNKYATFID